MSSITENGAQVQPSTNGAPHLNSHANSQPSFNRTATETKRPAKLRRGDNPEYTGKLIDPLEAQHSAIRQVLANGDGDKIRDLKDSGIGPEHFQDQHARTIAEVLWKQFEAGAPINLVTIAKVLKESGQTEAFTELFVFMPTPEREPSWKDCLHTVLNWKKAKAADPDANPFKPVKLRDIMQRPRPLWLVQGLFLEIGTGLITGNAGAFKSINALDLGLCIASGRDWHGHQVKQGAVVYIVAEGAYTTTDRARAWSIRHEVEIPENFEVVEIPAAIADPVTRALFLEGVAASQPALIVLDTLAQCNAGRNENDSGEMSVFTNAMKEISTALNCFVLTIHHNNKEGGMRGSTSIEANTDAHISFKRSAGRVVTVNCERIKNTEFEPFALIGHIQELNEQDEYEQEITSLVFEATEPPAKAEKQSASEKTCLEVLPQHGAKSEEWFRKASEKGISKTSFYRCRDNLEGKKQVELDTKTGVYHPQSQSPK
jgi:hypothetical protein